ncbi:MAG TPA: helix-turn-helix domain-containing protein [Pyrinomonadaceae bacterium]|nr:helix-turn-helix domain-containing protein [Pyrinomonadaceae bacterium]
MSKTSDYSTENLDQHNLRAGADLRLRLLTLKDLAHAFLEELGTVGGGGDAAAEPAGGPIDFYDEVRRFEIEMIQSALRRTNGVQTEAAALLRLKPTTLHAKLKQYGLSASDFTLRAASANQTAAHGEGAPRGGYAGGEREEEDERVAVLA